MTYDITSDPGREWRQCQPKGDVGCFVHANCSMLHIFQALMQWESTEERSFNKCQGSGRNIARNSEQWMLTAELNSTVSLT
jgi:hypothetical protein